MDGTVTDKGYQSLKSKNKKLFDLYNRVSHFMLPYFNVEGDGKLYLEPRDDNRFGFRVGCTGSEYVLYQYLDPFDLIDTDDMCFSEYFREVARTPDLKKMKKCLWMLANRYTEDVVYTVPLSLDTYTESAGVKHIGRRSYCAWGRKDDFTAAEKKALESVRNYVKKFSIRKVWPSCLCRAVFSCRKTFSTKYVILWIWQKQKGAGKNDNK